MSLESVNYQGRYLRHCNYAIRLDPNDGTAAFRGDAAFYRVAGLADSTRASFRSYNVPDRHLRHYDFVLRIDPLSSSSPGADRQDATFRLAPWSSFWLAAPGRTVIFAGQQPLLIGKESGQ
ncbi:AbfB domain-containing protein [Actinoplanes sp. NBRC 103695]|uniref:AbfB domain-containing protein n=1 Tax=Actinoplanes sp. NBRC 103695 TaxID=3032202 RepID=UPI0024A1D269|nr:AbfB domain-containing protein [Actinoplanes sp. NBRC 103695]GLY95369.1 hypothetical protein Acsp02_26240 [Actinoplanes sp. NBRC 103695]